MRMRNLYLILFIFGVIGPFYYPVMFVAENGLNFHLMLTQIFSNYMSSFFAWNVIITAVVLLLFIFSDVTRETIKYLWMSILATIIFGVSAGLPLFLYLREGYLEENDVSNEKVAVDE